MLVIISPTIVETVVAKRIGIKTSVGFAAPISARYRRTVTGISVSPEVFSTRNMIIELLAVSFLSLISCSSCIALSPMGVAALSRPSMLAEKFMNMVPITGCPLGISGKMRHNTGLNNLARADTSPPFSPIFIIPIHSESTPVRPKEISNAVLA